MALVLLSLGAPPLLLDAERQLCPDDGDGPPPSSGAGGVGIILIEHTYRPAVGGHYYSVLHILLSFGMLLFWWLMFFFPYRVLFFQGGR